MPRRRFPRRLFSAGADHDDRRWAPVRVEAAPTRPGLSSQPSGRPAGDARKSVPRRSGTRTSLPKNRVILIASPWADSRRRWRRGLADRFKVEEVGTYPNLEASIARFEPDALILDVSLLPIDGIGAVRRWSLVTKVLLVGGTSDETEVLSVWRAGAKGYCQRDSDPSLLRKAVDMVQNGEVWIGGRLAASLLEEPRLVDSQRRSPTGPPSGSLDGLTSRECEVARLVGGGARNKEIASELRITEATVKAHLTAVFRKLALSDRLHLGLLLAGHRVSRRSSAAAR